MSTNTNTTSSKSVIAAPAYYDGNAGDFQTFIHQTYLYIEGNVSTLSIDKMKIMFIVSYM